MPGKEKSSPKVKNAGKKRRIVSDPKVVNRTGGRKPQPQRITSEGRVQAICKKVQARTSEFLKLRNIEETVQMMYFIDFWSGASTFEPHSQLEPETAKLVQEAFFYGCDLVPDSAIAYIDDELAVRGRSLPFFAQLTEQKAQKETARREQRRNNNRRSNTPRALQNGMSQQLAASGHAAMVERQKEANRNRLAAMAAASGKSV